MTGYGKTNIGLSGKEEEFRKEQIKRLDELAKKKSKELYEHFIKSLDQDCNGLSGTELIALSTFTGTLFISSIVYGFYYDIIKKDMRLKKLYSEAQVEEEIIKSIKHYSKNIRDSLKNDKTAPRNH